MDWYCLVESTRIVFVPASAVLVVKTAPGCTAISCVWSFVLSTTETADGEIV